MVSISIAAAKKIREEIGATHLVIFAVAPDGTQHVATHGESRRNAEEAAKAGNKLKSTLGWPDDLCRSRPLPRIHENCAFYEKDFGMWCFNGWTGDGSEGWCNLEPQRTKQKGVGIACRHFEPRA